MSSAMARGGAALSWRRYATAGCRQRQISAAFHALPNLRAAVNPTVSAAVTASASPFAKIGWFQPAAFMSTEPEPVSGIDHGQRRKPSSSFSKWKPVFDHSLKSRKGAEGKEDQSQHLRTILHNLNLNVQRTGRALPGDIVQIFQLMQDQGHVSSNNALMLLKCCGSILPDLSPQERAELAQKVWRFYEDSGVQMDASHYNTLLKVNIENEVEFVPSEFLSWMEGQKNVQPNRVTFQHLISRYCQTGDIAGATTVLEHMKEENMAINENVFHSLIIGHCRSGSGDFESAKGVLQIMSESPGLDVGGDTLMVYVKELVRAGKEFRAELDEVAQKYGVQFSDRDYFGLMLELIKAGRKSEAEELVALLPKKSGFFQEMRNSLPQMIIAGEPELPFRILMDFKPPNSSGSEIHPESANRDHGSFFLKSLVRCELPPAQVTNFVKKLSDGAQGGLSEAQYSCRVLEAAVDLGKVAYGQKLYDALAKEFSDNGLAVDQGHLSNFIRLKVNELNEAEEVIRLLADLSSVGLRPLVSSISQSLLPKILGGTNKSLLPAQVISEIRRVQQELQESLAAETTAADLDSKSAEPRAPIPYSTLSNAMIQYLLNQENQEDFGKAVGYAVNVGFTPRPQLWNASLTRAYLATKNVDLFTTLLAVSSSRVTNIRMGNDSSASTNSAKDNDLFKAICSIESLAPRFCPGEKPEDLLLPVLKGLAALNVGIPAEVGQQLREGPAIVGNDVLVELTHDLERKYLEQEWTKDSVNDMLENRRKLLRVKKAMSMAKPGSFVPISSSGFVASDDLPSDLSGIKRVAKLLEAKGLTNTFVDNRLMAAYLQDDRMEEAEALGDKIKAAAAADFAFSPVLVENFVQACIRHKDLDKAADFLKQEVSLREAGKAFLSTYVNLAVALAEQRGDHAGALDILRSVSQTRLISKKGPGLDVARLLKYYADSGDAENLKVAFEGLKEIGLLDLKGGAAFSGLVDVHLTKGDPESAVAAFEEVARDYKKLPSKHALMEKLIEAEDMERMQRVLDASIAVVGEEKSLYDLASNFLQAGRTSQAKKLLETPGLRYNHEKISYIVKQLADNGKLEALRNFVLLSQPIFSCDRDYLYTKLVEACRGDAAKVKEAWLAMQEEGHAPSDRLKALMASALQEQGSPVPFEVPQGMVKVKPKTTKENDVVAANGGDGRLHHPELMAAVRAGRDAAQILPLFKEAATNIGPATLKTVLEYVDKCLDGGQLSKADAADFMVEALSKVKQATLFKSLNEGVGILNRLDGDTELLTRIRDASTDDARAVFILDNRIMKSAICSDAGKFLNHLEEASGDHRLPTMSNIVEILRRGPPDAADRLRALAGRLALTDETNRAFAMETLKALLISGSKPQAEALWAQVGGDADSVLNQFTVKNLQKASTEEMKLILDYMKTVSVNSEAGEKKRELLTRLFNLSVSAAAREGKFEDFATLVNEALSNWTSLDGLSNANLKAVAAANPDMAISSEVKKKAAEILAIRKTESKKPKKIVAVSSSSSSSSSSSDSDTETKKK